MTVCPSEVESLRVLVANRGEIALRIIRTADELGFDTVAVYAADDAAAAHVDAASTAVALDGSGPAAYLNRSAIVDAAVATGADLVHPGYGFLSEDPEFAWRCRDAGLAFVGPDAALLRLFGDKSSARAAAVAAGIAVLDATEGGVEEGDVASFLDAHPDGIMLKAVAGGGGRGMRAVYHVDEVPVAYRSCVAEAEAGFGNGALFAESLCSGARHVEVQVVAAPDRDGSPRALAVGDRDCSVQRRRQKLIEVAPAPHLDNLRSDLHRAAVRLCADHAYRGLATVEFLVTGDDFVFLEVNPRIQVEHTVTEEVTGVDLVEVGLRIAQGASLAELPLPHGVAASSGEVTGAPSPARGIAIQARVNTETVTADGTTVPATGTLTTFSPPTGPGVRVDTHGRPATVIGSRYDSLLAKVITHTRSADFAAACRKAETALAEFVVEGVHTNIALLRAVLSDDRLTGAPVSTSYLDEHLADLLSTAAALVPNGSAHGDDDPSAPTDSDVDVRIDDGEEVIRAGLTGVVVEVSTAGSVVPAGAPLLVLEAMKMQHVLAAERSSIVVRSLVEVGAPVNAGDPLAVVCPGDGIESDAAVGDVDPEYIRADLSEVLSRQAKTLDAARPEAVARRHRIGRRTARENIDDLVDDGSLTEYGALAVAAQRTRRSEQDLIDNTPADGLIAGVATVDADVFGSDAATTGVISYDYTVLAGTQGMRNHVKTDRILEVVRRKRIPLVLFAEGGGGRPGDTDANGAAGLELNTFRAMAGLQGVVPTVAIVSGRCFAGNAALAGVCDVLIATPDATVGMGGPAMIEGGGLGRHRPEEVGPIGVQVPNGVVHLVADDEAAAVRLARQYLSYFRGDLVDWTAPDARRARHVVPENRLRAFDVRDAVAAIADVDSVLELRRGYGTGMVTALIRVEGAAFGVLANSSLHLGGAIDAEAADKAADFLTMCEAHRMPVLTLCDTPGFMVGPESEEQATVRRFGKMFVAGARLTVPFGMIILRKAYGLGAMAMGGGSFHAPEFTVAWPTGEIGPMGLEGSVRLGYRKELEAIDDAAQRDALFRDLVAQAYDKGKALHAGTTFELDDVIDPARTRDWIRQLRRGPQVGPRWLRE
ncbi:acetyl-CoA carboxylase family protein [Gordonia rhizosphera]|uniref:Putative acyl-CoA carboxylase n=1 Tax=Gordonia rhizosphera NBRC 16068 TaxID=1108045 RepID=K6WD18_9ACTN|nr:carboxyl transferase domain-containing protein [Gordonia rhizosphera]GAB90087.1 putative acyl-CoA carboxylase [Gordonia rhizosphera NBRC 16068]